MRHERARVRMAAALAMAAATAAAPCAAQGKKRPAGPTEPPRSAPTAVAAQGDGLRLAGTDALGYLVIPDLEALLTHAEATGNAVAPSAMPPGATGSGLAQMLGLPGLEGLAARPILLVVLKGLGPMAPPRPVLFLPVKDAKTYEDAVTKMGWKSRRAPGLLIAASTPEALAASAKLEGEYKRVSGAGAGHDLRLFLEVGRLMDAYGPLMQMGMDAAMAPKPSPDPAKKDAGLSPGAAKLLKVEMKALLALLGQTDHVQWDLDLQGEGLLSDTVFAAKAGTALDELGRMPPAGVNRAAALLSGGSGFMNAAYALDAPRLAAFLNGLLKEAASDPADADVLTPEVLDLVDQAGKAYGGKAAYRMSAGAGGLSVEGAAEVTDEATTLAMFEKGIHLVAPTGPWANLLEDARMSVVLQKNARRHGGVAVHRLKMKAVVKAGAKPLTPQEKAAQAPFLRDTEFAVTHGYYLSAQDAAALDALIDRAASDSPGQGLALRAAQDFGDGRHVYVDYDLVGLMKAASAMTPAAKGQPNPFASLPDSAEPMLWAATFSDGRIRWQSKLPLKSFALMSEAAKKGAASPEPGKTPPPPRRP